ncbi:MAG: hypothetical protein ACOC2W_00750 [bacterium]
MEKCFNCGSPLPKEVSDENTPFKIICPTCGANIEDQGNTEIPRSEKTIGALSSGLLAFKNKNKNIF